MRITETTAAPGNWPRFAQSIASSLTLLVLAAFCSGCNGLPNLVKQTSTQPAPQTYMAPYMVGDESPLNGVASYQIDDTALTFNKSNYVVGSQLDYAGTTSALSNGILSLDVTYASTAGQTSPTRGWAFELP